MLPPPEIRGTFRTDVRARAAYAEGAGIYRILPQAVCLPADVADLTRLVCWAADHRISLVPRGAGSAMGGGNVGPGVVVDLTRMTGGGLDVDGAMRRAVTSAATTLAALNSASSRYGLRLPPDPSSGRWATLGGMVATNAAGARSVRYGSVRRWVEGLTLVTADGELLMLRRGDSPEAAALAVRRFTQTVAPQLHAAASAIRTSFPATRKNSSGYALDAYLSSGDLLDLVIGSEGTLGVVTEIEWRLDPIPSYRAAVRVALSSLDQLSEAVQAMLLAQPSAIELLDRSFLDLVATDTVAGTSLRFPSVEAVLLVELERDDAGSLRDALEVVTARVRPIAYSVDTAFSEAAAGRLWAIRHAASPILAALPPSRRSLQVIEDACVPVARMGEYTRLVRQSAAARGIPVVMFGHAGDGHLHVNLLPDVDQSGWESAVASLLEEVTEAVAALGGTTSGEHGDGRLRAPSLHRMFGREMVDLFRRVKDAFDPQGVFNPGVILPDNEPSISRLKVGGGAAPLPADIERGLREIEVTGGYARCRLELAGEVASN
ncbi:MAG TPA: FAD-binding oxidoreductase [Gemmatimonadales bacterium]